MEEQTIKREVHLEPLEEMVKGMDIAANAVGATLGPCGRNVFIDHSYLPTMTNDGTTVASSITLQGRQGAGAYLIKNAAGQTNDDAGDGTTTTAVLTQAVVHECLKRPENAMRIRESLKKAVEKVLKLLSKKSISIGIDDVYKVALVSSESFTVAKLISDIVKKLGKTGVITVEDSKTFSTEYEIVDGYEAEVGMASPHFANDKLGKAIYTDVPVLVCEKRISNIIDIKSIFDQFKEQGINACVIVCDDIEDSILGLLAANKLAGNFNSLIIKAHGDELKDIEGATGAVAVSDANGVTFQNVTISHLGKAKKVTSDAKKTIFVGNGIHAKTYAKVLESTLEAEQNQYVAKRIEKRIAKLKGGLAILKIGMPTDLERDYLRRKAEDAVKAVHAALEEGIVEGGGMALFRIAEQLKGSSVGEEILKKALSAPIRKIIENAGKDYATIVKGMVGEKGYDAKNDTYCAMVASGIIDPTKVERCAVENAVSAAGTFITTACYIGNGEKS